MSFLITAAATTPTYTLSLHDALPIFRRRVGGLAEARALAGGRADQNQPATAALLAELGGGRPPAGEGAAQVGADHERSEEHTSELQSRRDLVCRLLLEKKKSATTGEP